MTSVCPGGGPSQPLPGLQANMVLAGGLAAAFSILPGFEILTPIAATFEVGAYNLPSFCAAEPPTFPTFTTPEIEAYGQGLIDQDYYSFLTKAKDFVGALFWYQQCQCVTGPQPTMPTPPALPSDAPVFIGPSAVPVSAACASIPATGPQSITSFGPPPILAPYAGPYFGGNSYSAIGARFITEIGERCVRLHPRPRAAVDPLVWSPADPRSVCRAILRWQLLLGHWRSIHHGWRREFRLRLPLPHPYHATHADLSSTDDGRDARRELGVRRLLHRLSERRGVRPGRRHSHDRARRRRHHPDVLSRRRPDRRHGAVCARGGRFHRRSLCHRGVLLWHARGRAAAMLPAGPVDAAPAAADPVAGDADAAPAGAVLVRHQERHARAERHRRDLCAGVARPPHRFDDRACTPRPGPRPPDRPVGCRLDQSRDR